MRMYSESKTRARRLQGCSDYFEIKVGMHQGSALSPLLFLIVTKEATRNCRSMAPWDIIYSDDFVLSAETVI